MMIRTGPCQAVPAGPALWLAAAAMAFSACASGRSEAPERDASAILLGKNPPNAATPALTGGGDLNGPKLSCGRLVPADFADRFFHRAERSEKSHGSGRVTCTFSGGVLSHPVSLDFICSEHVVRKRFLDQARMRFGNMAYREVEGLGRLAFAREDMQVVFWDDDTPCLIVLTGFSSRLDLVEVAHDFLRALTPESLGGD
jgi:hypothetical protein